MSIWLKKARELTIVVISLLSMVSDTEAGGWHKRYAVSTASASHGSYGGTAAGTGAESCGSHGGQLRRFGWHSRHGSGGGSYGGGSYGGGSYGGGSYGGAFDRAIAGTTDGGDQARPTAGAAATPPSDGAMLTVKVPEGAKVLINGKETKASGTVRRYVSKGMKSEATYEFVVKVIPESTDGKAATQEKKITLKAGANETVSFETPEPELIPAGKPKASTASRPQPHNLARVGQNQGD